MAYNELLIEEEDFKSLRDSIETFGQFDSIALAQRLEKHELLEFRRVAAILYKKNRRWKQSINLSKKDKLFKDAMETATESKDAEMAEGLLSYFIEIGRKDCFAAALYVSYDMIRPDVVMELAWRNNLQAYATPYMIQVISEYTAKVSIAHDSIKVDKLESMLAERVSKDEEKEKQEAAMLGPGLGMPLMITNGGPQAPQYTGVMPQQTGPGMQGIPQQFTGMQNSQQFSGGYNPQLSPQNYAGMNGFPPQNFQH